MEGQRGEPYHPSRRLNQVCDPGEKLTRGEARVLRTTGKIDGARPCKALKGLVNPRLNTTEYKHLHANAHTCGHGG